MMISISNQYLTATINPKGAELSSLKHQDREIMWEGNPDFWGKHAPVLFPIVGTLKNNEFEYSGKKYSLPRHGFARDLVFEVSEKRVDRVTFTLKSSAETLEKFPFTFEFSVIFILKEKTLLQYFQIKNEGQDTMYFSVGGHPAFALPGNFEDYSIHFDQDDKLEVFALKDDLLSGKTSILNLEKQNLPLSQKLFENDALVVKKYVSKVISILKNGKDFLHFSTGNFPNLGLWTKPNAPFICIEPWFGYADDITCTGKLTEKEGIVAIDSQEIFETHFAISIP
ncbi:aldose 1-epimerase family protein [Flavobacterium sp. NST-5]|uniref:Aldose 1-epimerase family protein n=1 Tax=Flavobacterium ichthyis TaxID=2698827 RepID=A0ABW9ZAB0_9FLAO|nr:aldose 1-epimerase family protein [Flavobacterium ichthyis]NBL64257.1 aldose 1-epimerase family protein [Flavobacterium ichthyis]